MLVLKFLQLLATDCMLFRSNIKCFTFEKNSKSTPMISNVDRPTGEQFDFLGGNETITNFLFTDSLPNILLKQYYGLKIKLIHTKLTFLLQLRRVFFLVYAFLATVWFCLLNATCILSFLTYFT